VRSAERISSLLVKRHGAPDFSTGTPRALAVRIGRERRVVQGVDVTRSLVQAYRTRGRKAMGSKYASVIGKTELQWRENQALE
jgi:hypothetical protein